MNESILLVEDEEDMRKTLGVRLRGEGYIVDTAVDGLEGFDKATTMPFDVIILDVILPLRNGFDVCRDIRKAGLATPIVLLTARSETIDKVVGLKLGADDYVTKPFQAAELIARIEALLRRVPVPSNNGIYEFGPIRIDVKKKEVTRAGEPVYLTGREFQLLCYLAERAGSTLPRSEILQFVWGYEDGTLTRTVDMHIASLRNKLEENPKHPELILTATGVGYKFIGSKTV